MGCKLWKMSEEWWIEMVATEQRLNVNLHDTCSNLLSYDIFSQAENSSVYNWRFSFLDLPLVFPASPVCPLYVGGTLSATALCHLHHIPSFSSMPLIFSSSNSTIS